MDRSSVSRLVNQLKQSGYVKSEPSPDDRRAVLLSLTELGRQTAVMALKEKEQLFYESVASLENAEIERFIDMLRHFNSYHS